MTVLAAIDDSAVARPVLDFARRAATLLDTTVEAVHVQEDGSGEHAASIADAAQVPLRFLHGDVVGALESEVLASDALALVIGTRGHAAGAAPAGHVALDVVQALGCTVVVVPPDAEDRPLRRVLVAVEGDGVSPGLRRLVEQIGERPTPELIALHVIEPADVPPSPHPGAEAEAFDCEIRIRVAARSSPTRGSCASRCESAIPPRRCAKPRRSSTPISSCSSGTGSSRRRTVGSSARCSPTAECRWRSAPGPCDRLRGVTGCVSA